MYPIKNQLHVIVDYLQRMQQRCLPFVNKAYNVASALSKLLLVHFIFFASHPCFAEGSFSLRKLLNRIHINVSAGYGRTSYCNQAVGDKLVMFKKEGKFYIPYTAKNNGEPIEYVYLVRWVDDAYVLMENPEMGSEPSEKDKVDGKVKFVGAGNSFPIVLSGHVDILRKMRLGLGGALFIHKLDSLKFVKDDTSGKADLGSYTPQHTQHYSVRPFVLLGYKFIETSSLALLLDLNLGLDFVYANLSDPMCIDLTNAGVQNIGLTLERDISEYFRIFGRISYEKKAVVDVLVKEKLAVALDRSSALFQFGVSFNCPEVAQCPVSNCKIEVKHNHGGKLYRGVSAFKGRSSQDKRLYKK